MRASEFKFDSSQDFQLAAIASVVNLFDGMIITEEVKKDMGEILI